ncbi:bifunctional UDP-sugar hydrolase/5'-nucleotidase [Priestia aryabhattai]|uniref:bifunctional metallophosphatase/5'-nucleotidase n=1 Tax=Priestia aryabhattai TaxID=412384 RepID=UPI0039A24BEC
MLKKVIPLFVLISTLTVSTVTAAPANKYNPGNHYLDVQLLGINDFHGQLTTTSVMDGKEVGRADYLAAYLHQREKQNSNTLLVNVGDSVGGSPPISALLQDEPVITMFNKLGFDVGTLGNHEFDEGVDELKRMIYGGYHPKTGDFEGANFPYICANVVNKENNQPILPPYVIKKVKGVPIGFIGVVTTETPRAVLPSGVSSVRFLDEAASINKYVKELKKKGIKAIVVLNHVDGTTNKDGVTEGKLAQIAENVDDEVDVMFGAHNHEYMNGIVDGKLLVEAYSYGKAFADVDIKIDRKTKDIVEKKAEVVKTYHHGIKPDPQIKKLIEQNEKKVAPLINEIVGQAANEMTRTQNESGESSLGNLIADAQRTEMNTQIALTNSGGIRNDLNSGEITWGELYSIQPFGNQLVNMRMTGKDIRDVLNQQWQQGQTYMLQISGMKYTWDQNNVNGQKVQNMTLASGEPIVDTQVYTVTTNSFLSEGGDGFTKFLEMKNKEPGVNDLDALVNYVKKATKPMNTHIEGRIQKVN